MTAAEKLYQLVKTLPEDQVNEVLHFAEFLHKKSSIISSSRIIPPGTLTGLRGLIKQPKLIQTDEELQEEYTDYLIQKYQ